MECDPCNKPDVYEAAASDGANHAWFYVDNAVIPGTSTLAKLDWGKDAADILEKYLLGPSCGSCHVGK
jgi:hypothetical protein